MSKFTPEVIQVLNSGVVVVRHPLTGCLIFSHRFVKEMEVGRILTFDDIVYFKNGNVRDIKNENLALADRREFMRFRKSKKWPYPSKLTLWLLYKVFQLSTVTIGLIFNTSPSLTRAMFEYRKVQRVPRGKLTRRWNKLVRKVILYLRNNKSKRWAVN